MVPLVRNSLPKTSSVRVGFMYRIPSLQDDKKNLIVKENYFYLELFSLKSSKEFLNFSFFHQFFYYQKFYKYGWAFLILTSPICFLKKSCKRQC